MVLRKFRTLRTLLIMCVAAALVLAACGQRTDQAAGTGPSAGDTGQPGEGTSGEEGRFGGTMRVALYSEPPTLDSAWTTALIVLVPSQHVYEYLFAFDENWVPQPHLVESYDVSSDGLHYTFRLRRGVKFHNGDEMKAEDVVASLKRWGVASGKGRAAFESITDVSATDDYTVEIKLHTPFAPLITYLTGPLGAGAIITTKEAAEAAGEDQLEPPYIGTGPYKFVEQVPDSHIRLARFEDYAARSEPPSGYAGRRTAYFDEILFMTVPDAAARIAGVETGDYHWAEEVTRDEYERLANHPDIDAIVIKPLRFQALIFNKKRGPFTDVKLRQAVLWGINNAELLAAGFGSEQFWRVDPSIMPQETAWYSTAGAEGFAANDLERARQLVEESSYNGETVRWMAPSDREDYFGVAVAGVQQLKQIGINVELVPVDWGTLVERRTQPDQYEIFNTGFEFSPEPTTYAFIPSNWPGWWESERKEAILSQLMSVTDFDQRKKLWEDFQALMYEEVPLVKVGDFFGLSIKRKEVKGESVPISSLPIFWNTWFENQ